MCVSKMFHSLALGRDLLTASAAVYKSLALGLTTRPKFRKMGWLATDPGLPSSQISSFCVNPRRRYPLQKICGQTKKLTNSKRYVACANDNTTLTQKSIPPPERTHVALCMGLKLEVTLPPKQKMIFINFCYLENSNKYLFDFFLKSCLTIVVLWYYSGDKEHEIFFSLKTSGSWHFLLLINKIVGLRLYTLFVSTQEEWRVIYSPCYSTFVEKWHVICFNSCCSIKNHIYTSYKLCYRLRKTHL